MKFRMKLRKTKGCFYEKKIEANNIMKEKKQKKNAKTHSTDTLFSNKLA